MAESAFNSHLRLAGLLLLAPIGLSALATPYLSSFFTVPIMLALVCVGIAASWGLLVGLASTGRDSLFAAAGLVLGGLALTVVIAAAGGVASPVTLMLIALPLEAWWVKRSRRAAQAGFFAAASVLGVLVALQGAGLFLPLAPSAFWHWLLPIGYAFSLLQRFNQTPHADVVPTSDPTSDPTSELEALSDAAVLRVDSAGEVVSVNRHSQTVLGLPGQHLRGQGFFERLHVADRVTYLTALADLRLTGVDQTLDVRLRVPEGETGSAVKLFALTMVQRKIDLSVFLSVRSRGEEVDLKHRLEEAIERADRLELTKSRFLAAVSHELRTPLNAIIGFSEMMNSGMAGPFADPRQAEYVGIIRESGQHLLSVVNSILDVSKIESGTYTINAEPFPFADAVEFCRAMLAGQAKTKAISLRVQIERDIGDVCGDRRAIQQTLINLVGNAIKFTPEGGAVTIGAHRQGRRLQFWVSDTGIGIAACDLEQIGRPFVQVCSDYNRQHEGAGLGLSIVKGLVELHQGTLSVASAPGEGTTVTVTLPIDGPETDAAIGGSKGTERHGRQIAESFRKSA
ncbi:ATP-binding protein [Tianweitania sediminis]|uniref:histidine kinase n=1 Tax=Tianweitania sediminis TaxID=1502156 RepID=A0A8J7R1G6_9HYPH|nr:PAS domain-containing sensor histidine kinase [Tianweitania sediminis]